MSIVAVHGPYTFGSRGITETEELVGTVSPTNGLIWDFRLDYPTTRSAQDFSWAFPPDGTPTPQAVIDPAAVTYGSIGAKTVTLTVTNTARATVNNRALASNVATLLFSAPHGFVPGQIVTVTGAVGAPFTGTFTLTTASGTSITYPCVGADVTSGATTGTVTSASTQYPAAGAHTISITAYTGAGAAGTSPLMVGGEEDDEYFDPADYTVPEVVEYAEANPDQLEDIIAAEEAGKDRTTLLTQLENLRPEE